jgi:two-component system OmpR family sensor kinase
LKGRFERAGPGATGAGLGLAIAEAIAAGAGANLDLRSPASGRTDGFEAVLRVPTTN